MKKAGTILFAAFAAALTLFAVPAMAEEEQESSNILIAYISRAGENYNVGEKHPDSASASYAGYIEEGNTAKMAKILAELTGGELYAIEVEDAYPEDYASMLERAQQELDEDARPALAGELPDLEGKDTIFIGYPIWHAAIPRPVLTFLESYDLSGKTLVPFNTHEGSGQAGTVSEIEEAMGDALLLEGLAVQGKTAQEDEEKTRQLLTDWLTELGFLD